MNYEYSGYLSTILYTPDEDARDSIESVVFSSEDLAKWRPVDLPEAVEWRSIPVKKTVSEDAVTVEGDFKGVRGIDVLSSDVPRYWVALSTVGLGDARMPIDVTAYPIIEITYRCASDNVHPALMWTYAGGSHFTGLPKSAEWITVARNVQHFGFPAQVENVVLRVYSPTRTVESVEVASLRFRAMTEAETKAMKKSYASLKEHAGPKKHAVLDEFMPLGVHMDANRAKRCARMLGISAEEYWDLALQDLVVHNHNAIALGNVDRLSATELSDLLKQCEHYGIKIVARHNFPLDGPEEERTRIIEDTIALCAESNAVLAHTFSSEPEEVELRDILAAKELIEQSDPSHPVALMTRYPNAYPLFAPFFAASGMGHFTSSRPWDLGEMVRKHAPLSQGQQFWVAAPGFMYPTRTPEWSTCPEMRLMVNLGFLSGARGWFTYSYHNDPVWTRGRIQRTLTGPFLAFSDLWSELMRRMKHISALAPLFLQAQADEKMDKWFTQATTTASLEPPAPGVPPVSQYRLRGPDFSIYATVSNNVRDMAELNFDIPRKAVGGKEIYDLTEYVTSRYWGPMERQRHIEMFPGQAHMILVASPEACSKWREIIGQRLIADDLNKLRFNLRLANAYKLNFGDIEDRLGGAEVSADQQSPEAVSAAKDELVNLIYTTPEIAESRSKIIETRAAVCACDGALCRLLGLKSPERIEELGEGVVSLAAEFTQLRMELWRGNGAKMAAHCTDLNERMLTLLAEIRAEYRP